MESGKSADWLLTGAEADVYVFQKCSSCTDPNKAKMGAKIQCVKVSGFFDVEDETRD